MVEALNNEAGTSKAIFHIASIAIVSILLLAFTSMTFLALVGALFSLYVFTELLFGFGQGIPVNLIIIFLACLQWIVGPILSYYTGVNHPFYGMQVPEEEYFSFAVPGVILYHLGLLLPVARVRHISRTAVQELEEASSHKIKGAYYLIVLGFLASISSSFVPPSLFFFLYLLSLLKFVGAFYLYISPSRNNTILYIVFAALLLEVLASAVFHDLVLWAMFFLFIYTIKNKVSLKKKLFAVFVGFFMLLVLQAVKYQYRNIAWSNASLSSFNRTELFMSMVMKTLYAPEQLLDIQRSENTITRLNQGWIITRVMRYIPYNQPFAEGETINAAFSAALLPRFISENKAIAGGRGNMQRFTGIILQDGTSMNISLLGEGYGNYGRTGAIWFMFLIGIVFSFILRVIILKSRQHPTYVLWIPFLFLQVVKAETDLATTLNYLVKATIVMLLVFYSFRKVLKVEI
ncbi:hypothetical protein [Pontibacter liquoris]|uniref:hypothetical protein n=1 Tax=Pontibacter liquoris TaxID=2905677 RepID=UPI001FA6FC9B|nr:hypothetical protein [Pontibacter liquoris]